MKNSNGKEITVQKKVAVITRTKNRPIMLLRVRASVQNQRYKDFIWIVVNDAGDKIPVEKEVKKASDQGITVKLIHRSKSTGMEAASNDGIAQSNSEYVVIHDDDDTWHPDFLEQTVRYLDENQNYVGVITHTKRIDEKLSGDEIILQNESYYNRWIQAVYMADLCIVNRFPPISFLFRRVVYEKVGGFDETLPVLGDWDFNLRVLIEGDIGVIQKVLANYHFRVESKNKESIYGNSVTSGVQSHIEYNAIYVNRKLREDIRNNQLGLGFMLSQSRMNSHVYEVLNRVFYIFKKIIGRLPLIPRFLERF